MAAFLAYHGVGADTHQQHVDELAPQGYRPISLNVSGAPDDPVYAAVWLQSPGPEWEALHRLDEDGYQDRFSAITGRGLEPVSVSAAGRAGQASYAAWFERLNTPRWFARHRITFAELVAENDRAIREGYIPRTLTVYGTGADQRFAGVWLDNSEVDGGPVPWTWAWCDPDDYQRRFDAALAGGLRPSHVAVAPDGWCLAVFRDQPLGEFRARHRISGDDYQAEFDARVASGLMPVMVQAGGVGGDTRYACVFARGPDSLPRTWTVTGTYLPGIEELDAVVRQLMGRHSIRAATVAVAREGRLIASRGYTWAEAGYRVTEPTTPFRLASVSKMFTNAAVEHLVAAGRLQWSTAVFPFLGVTSAALPDQTVDPATPAITVQQIVRMTSRMRRYLPGDNSLREVARRLGIGSTPTRAQIVSFVYGEPLDPPAAGDMYSNPAFTVLTSVVEQAAGRPLADLIVAEITGPMGLQDVWVASTTGPARPEEVPSYDSPYHTLTQRNPSSIDYEPNALGGTFVLEVGEGSGGLVSSAPTLARFIGSHAVWYSGAREMATRYGELDGTFAAIQSRASGFDVAFLVNRRVPDTEQDPVCAAIGDLVDRYGSTWAVPLAIDRVREAPWRHLERGTERLDDPPDFPSVT